MKKAIKIIRIGQTFTACVYLIIYLFISFCEWEFRNPFQWIIDVPTYTNGERGEFLAGIIFYYLIVYIVVVQHQVTMQTEAEKIRATNSNYALTVINWLTDHGYYYDRKDGYWITEQRPNAVSKIYKTDVVEEYERNKPVRC